MDSDTIQENFSDLSTTNSSYASSTRSKRSSVKSKRGSVKSKRGSAKSKRGSVKSKRSSVKSKRSSVKSKRGSVKSKSGSVKSKRNNRGSEKYEDFTWTKISPEWEKKLITKCIVVKDTNPDGNCQFRSIENALVHSGYKTNHMKLRKVIAKYIKQTTDDQFYEILQNYKIEKLNGEFRGHWNPFNIKTRNDFIKVVVKSGFDFEGDYITLSILSSAIKIDFVIFDQKTMSFHNITDNENTNEKMLFLMYQNINNTGHYKTLGYRLNNGKIITLFKKTNIPIDLQIILHKKQFITEHLKEIVKNNNIEEMLFTDVLSLLENNTYQKYSNDDVKKISALLKEIIIL